MTIKQIRIAIDPTNTYAILTITDEFGNDHELTADPEQVEQMYRILQYTNAQFASLPSSTPEMVGLLH